MKENKPKRKLFCQISPLTYKISIVKCRFFRKMKNLFFKGKFATEKQEELLPFIIYKHNSLIKRQLANVDMVLQENKAVNLSLATPKISKILIKPRETFSFWRIAKKTTIKKGYKEGLVIANGKPAQGLGGGLCQLTNLIHWMILHTPMTITEHHHHDGLDLFPDFKRQIPFGTGTSIMYNYLDYRFKNSTETIFQIVTYVTDQHLCGEIRANKPLEHSYHVKVENEFFSKENNDVFRNGHVYKKIIDKKTGICLEKSIIRINHAKVYYDTSHLTIVENT